MPGTGDRANPSGASSSLDSLIWLERPGQGFTAVVELNSEVRPLREYWLSSQAEGKEVERKIVALAGIFSKPPFSAR